jgi:hypothetical protein
MYGSVLSGGLAGHVYGTAAYDLTSTGEPEGWRPHIWTALNYTSGGQMQHLRNFVTAQGPRYQTLVPASADISTRASTNSEDKGLDGWAFLMRAPDRDYALAYFETKSPRPRLAGFMPGQRYAWRWYDVRTGAWAKSTPVRADRQGSLTTPMFPQGGRLALQDVAAEVTVAQ